VGREKGQALVFMLGFMASLLGVMLLVFNTGQVTTEKQRLVNAADAAAYSGAVWEARSLNLQAYMNRALVANEVAIAQSVSLRSWTSYLKQVLTNINTVGQFIPYVNAVTRTLQQVSTQIERVTSTALPPVEGGISGLNHVIAGFEEAVNAQAALAARSIAMDTLRANDRSITPTTAQTVFSVRDGGNWLRFTRSYRNNERTRLKDVVMSSRDGFSRARSWRFTALGVARFEKRAGTELIGLDTWRGVDTMSFHARRGIILGGFREVTPLGWGAAQNGRAAVRPRGSHDDSFGKNPNASRLAERLDLQSSRVRTYRGLSSSRDITNPGRRDERTLDFVIEAERPRGSVMTSDRALGVTNLPLVPAGDVAQLPAPHRDRVYAQSRAEIYFMRPEGRRDGRREYPNLYSPYWQVRLASVSTADRAIAAGAKQLVDPYVAVP
jgi:hypothetical protein